MPTECSVLRRPAEHVNSSAAPAWSTSAMRGPTAANGPASSSASAIASAFVSSSTPNSGAVHDDLPCRSGRAAAGALAVAMRRLYKHQPGPKTVVGQHNSSKLNLDVNGQDVCT